MKNILITGGAGFIGSNLAFELKKKGYNITILDNLSAQIHGDLSNSQSYQKIKDSKNFMSGTMCLRQLSLGYLDMAWFGKDNDVEDVEVYEWRAIKKTALMDKMPGASISCSLGHIFAGGYSAGYYSYKWAEVLEADAFESFKENGIFDKKTALSFRKNILSKGNLENPMNLYKDFIVREPRVDALLKRDGLI